MWERVKGDRGIRRGEREMERDGVRKRGKVRVGGMVRVEDGGRRDNWG